MPLNYRAIRTRTLEAIGILAGLLLASHVLPAQHLNPIVEKLSQGKVVLGVGSGDYSIDNAHALARADIDFVRLEMEHGPIDIERIYVFLNEMVDRAGILKKGNGQISVAPIARFPPYGRESSLWVSKQGLDAGLMGVAFNGVDNKEQTLMAVRGMRYPQRRGAQYLEPLGLRGYAPMNAPWFWGLNAEDYVRHADLWPLNPAGDLISIIMIETTEGLKNVDEIASVPGVGVIWPGAGADLSYSMGVPQNSPEVEEAFQKILKACLAHNVACGINPQPQDIPRRIKEGWKYLEIGNAGGGLSAGTNDALKIARNAMK
jgi:4-hydroxy-2-oxoheptanedioate aldolase